MATWHGQSGKKKRSREDRKPPLVEFEMEKRKTTTLTHNALLWVLW